jgi:hypothetical protein
VSADALPTKSSALIPTGAKVVKIFRNVVISVVCKTFLPTRDTRGPELLLLPHWRLREIVAGILRTKQDLWIFIRKDRRRLVPVLRTIKKRLIRAAFGSEFLR